MLFGGNAVVVGVHTVVFVEITLVVGENAVVYGLNTLVLWENTVVFGYKYSGILGKYSGNLDPHS